MTISDPSNRETAPALSDQELDFLAASEAHVMPKPGHFVLTLPMLRRIIAKAADIKADREQRPAALSEATTVPAWSFDLRHLIYETLKFYANVTSYQGERTGGVLASCPRGPKPTPRELTDSARLCLKRIDALRASGTDRDQRPAAKGDE